MKAACWAWGCLASLAALGLSLVAANRGQGRDDDDDKEPDPRARVVRADVLKLTDKIAAGAKAAEVQEAAEEIAKRHDWEFVMQTLYPRAKGGIGVGGKPGAIRPDGIELKLIAIGNPAPKWQLSEKDLTAQKDDLVRMAQATLAIGRLAPSYAPKKDSPGRPIKAWLDFSEELQTKSQDLIDAVKGGEPKRVQKAAGRLVSVCNDCHMVFR
jgi:hypothetical protein